MMAGLFAKTARPALLAAGRSGGLRRATQRLAVTRNVVRRFVPGETYIDALNTAARLRDSRQYVSLDYLGEDVADTAGTTANVGAYLQLLDAVGRGNEGAQRGVRPLEVSVKLSALGQALDRDGDKIALANAHRICERADAVGVWVTVDAEDHTTTDSTLSIATELRSDFGWLGTVLQAYLKRTEGDSRELAATGIRVRLCRGAYDEPASVAYLDRDAVTDSYLRCLRVLMAGPGYPMVASHDPAVIAAAAALAAENGRGPADFEYQMLYGIREDEQQRLADSGAQMRVYVPFGACWYGYFMRRLAERPANLALLLRALTDGGPTREMVKRMRAEADLGRH